jgi:hypothetical protein
LPNIVDFNQAPKQRDITPCQDGYEYTVEVGLGSVDPQSLLIENFADPQNAGGAFRRAMTRARNPYPGVRMPMENGRELWEQ